MAKSWKDAVNSIVENEKFFAMRFWQHHIIDHHERERLSGKNKEQDAGGVLAVREDNTNTVFFLEKGQLNELTEEIREKVATLKKRADHNPRTVYQSRLQAEKWTVSREGEDYCNCEGDQPICYTLRETDGAHPNADGETTHLLQWNDGIEEHQRPCLHAYHFEA